MILRDILDRDVAYLVEHGRAQEREKTAPFLRVLHQAPDQLLDGRHGHELLAHLLDERDTPQPKLQRKILIPRRVYELPHHNGGEEEYHGIHYVVSVIHAEIILRSTKR